MHLGRKLGYEPCIWFRLADTSIKLGTLHNDPKVVLNERRCAREAVMKFFDKERMCRACLRTAREAEIRMMPEGGEEEKEEVQE
jgi:hypothetical protein